jgi:predicted Zn-dependent protease
MFFRRTRTSSSKRKYASSEKGIGRLDAGGGTKDLNRSASASPASSAARPAYHFAAIEEGGANALALPGGYIYVTRDLLKEFKTEAHLAAVLSHEIGHVVARDTLVAMSEQIGMTALMVAAQAGGSADLARGTSFVTAVLSLQYSRDDEKRISRVCPT